MHHNQPSKFNRNIHSTAERFARLTQAGARHANQANPTPSATQR
ncbi:hypothetical protein T11_10461 [Trichinella zimbabwensis]|uniref:Uncharacterized protein n=1 Tax=Trichinella zimbabwensis TaxID=268475 RepID=A0A0V1G3N6_9BILA|nr:hypothetical protein T11_9531 [Trichinella zimbabwensis]KRY94221.1 hypothetical protein T11_10461 [Trichinella zimbabwensis]